MHQSISKTASMLIDSRWVDSVLADADLDLSFAWDQDFIPTNAGEPQMATGYLDTPPDYEEGKLRENTGLSSIFSR